MEKPLDKYPCMWCGDMVDHGKHDCGDDGQNTRTDPPEDITGLAHELWALAQLLPEEGILDGVMRIEEALQGKIKGTKDPLMEEMARALERVSEDGHALLSMTIGSRLAVLEALQKYRERGE
jgi:hypothetical protein